MNPNRWDTVCHLPDTEPDDSNADTYARPDLFSGASPDARFIFDAVYLPAECRFLLTLMEINEEWGFVEHESVCRPATRAELLRLAAAFQAAPEQMLHRPPDGAD